MKIITTSLLRTCYACPSQWDGVTDDGRAVYIRYRWGRLSVCVGEPGDTSEYAGVEGEEVLALKLEETGWDGCLTEEDLVDHLLAAGLASSEELPEGALTREEMAETMAKVAEGLEELIEKGAVKVIGRSR